MTDTAPSPSIVASDELIERLHTTGRLLKSIEARMAVNRELSPQISPAVLSSMEQDVHEAADLIARLSDKASMPVVVKPLTAAWLAYWPGAGSIDSVTRVTRSEHEAKRWGADGAEVSELIEPAPTNTIVGDPVAWRYFEHDYWTYTHGPKQPHPGNDYPVEPLFGGGQRTQAKPWEPDDKRFYASPDTTSRDSVRIKELEAMVVEASKEARRYRKLAADRDEVIEECVRAVNKALRPAPDDPDSAIIDVCAMAAVEAIRALQAKP